MAKGSMLIADELSRAALAFTGHWTLVGDALPDADLTVLMWMPGDASEPVWPGYWDGDRWMSAEGFQVSGVHAWTDFPKPPEVPHGA